MADFRNANLEWSQLTEYLFKHIKGFSSNKSQLMKSSFAESCLKFKCTFSACFTTSFWEGFDSDWVQVDLLMTKHFVFYDTSLHGELGTNVSSKSKVMMGLPRQYFFSKWTYPLTNLLKSHHVLKCQWTDTAIRKNITVPLLKRW